MSAEKTQTEPNFRLIHPYTFDECAFDFTDPRCERSIIFFGDVEFSQEIAEQLLTQDAMSGAAEFHLTFDEGIAVSAPTRTEGTAPHKVREQIGIADAAHIAEKEPIRSEFAEQLGIGVFALHGQHGHIYMDVTERIGISAVILPPMQTVIVERIGLRKEELPQLSTLIVESIDIAKSRKEMPYTVPQENIGACLARAYDLAHVLKDGIAVQDERGQVFTAHRSFAEEISMQEETHGVLHLYRSFVERIGLHTEILPPLSTLLVEGICLQGDRIPQPRSLISEKLVVFEALVPPLMSHFTEHIGVYDTVVRASDASISGVAVGNGMTLAEFKSRLMRPIGYEMFRPFHVGEYEYEQALVRISMTTGSLGAIPQIYDVVMNVDIDDTVDRGTARVEAKETEIPYHKHYYTKPEVTVTLQRGNTGDGVLTPEITMIGTDFFRCILHKRDGTAATGTVSWTAVGY